MHPQSPPLTIGETVLKESDDLVILGVTFDSKMTFEKHLRFVSRAASERLGILRKYWQVFHEKSLLVGCFRVLSCLFWCSVLQCGARLPIHRLNYWTLQSVVPCVSLGVCLSVTLLVVDLWQFCVCFIRSGATRCTRLMVLYLYVCASAGYTRCLVSHWYTYAPTRCRTSKYRMTFISLSVSLWNDLADPVFDGGGLAWLVSIAGPMLSYWRKLLYPYQ